MQTGLNNVKKLRLDIEDKLRPYSLVVLGYTERRLIARNLNMFDKKMFVRDC